MKTKEEILDQVNFFITPEKKQQILVAMEEYATQCQEDNKDKKYTEKDMEKAFIAGGKLARNIENPGFNDFINSLNKQDK